MVMPFEYDVFVSYRWVEPDLSWVRNELVPALHSAGLKVCLDVEDFVPGRDLILEMSRAGNESRRAICVLSPDYFEGERMVNFESLMARRRNPSGVGSQLIPLILRSCTVPEWLRGLIPIDWTIPNNNRREWQKLLKVLDAPKIDAKSPGNVIAELQHNDLSQPEERAISQKPSKAADSQSPSERALEPVAAKLALDKAIKLNAMDFDKEAIAAYDDLIARFGTVTEGELQQYIGRARD
jgi:hypothetical protein